VVKSNGSGSLPDANGRRGHSRAEPIVCDVAAVGEVRATTEQIAALRRAPGPTLGRVISPAVLKHADEQTIVGLAAVLRAITASALGNQDFASWGIVAAPRYLGRGAFSAALPRFLEEGAWGVSPHLIAHHSLHSPSGLISQVLKAHGPNFGAGGSEGSESDGLLSAAILLEEGQVTGVWVVMTASNSDDAPKGALRPDTLCEGVALALVKERPHWRGPRLEIAPGLSRLRTPLEDQLESQVASGLSWLAPSRQIVNDNLDARSTALIERALRVRLDPAHVPIRPTGGHRVRPGSHPARSREPVEDLESRHD
jgi:hypothetical protein